MPEYRPCNHEVCAVNLGASLKAGIGLTEMVCVICGEKFMRDYRCIVDMNEDMPDRATAALDIGILNMKGSVPFKRQTEWYKKARRAYKKVLDSRMT